MVSTSVIVGRKRARHLLLQSLYQWLMSDVAMSEIEAQFTALNNMNKVDVEYYRKVLYGVPRRLIEIEQAITEFLDRPIESLSPIELTVLRIACFELLECLEVPYRVILDEAVTLSRLYGAQDGHRYVNGVLHNLAKKIRIYENKN